MKRVLLATIATFGFSSVVFAEDFRDFGPIVTGSVGLEFAQNANDDIVADADIDVTIVTVASFGFASIGLAEVDGAIELDSYTLGTTIASVDLSFGDQGDILDAFEGSTEVVGGTTLANPADDHESLHVGALGVVAAVGFTDIGSDVTDIENVQLSYGRTFGPVSVVSGVDYNIDTKDVIFLTQADIFVSGYEASVTATYADAFAYEASTEAFGVTGFVNGDENDLVQNVGAGYYKSIPNTRVDFYAEGAYNLDAEEFTPALGVTLSF